jgi:hypothetical protein
MPRYIHIGKSTNRAVLNRQINYNGNTDDNRHVGKHKNYQLVGLLGDGESPPCHDHTMSPRDGFRSCL